MKKFLFNDWALKLLIVTILTIAVVLGLIARQNKLTDSEEYGLGIPENLTEFPSSTASTLTAKCLNDLIDEEFVAIKAVASQRTNFSGSLAEVEDSDAKFIWHENMNMRLTPASIAKLLVAFSVLTKLPNDKRIKTAVKPGINPGELVLVGRGDPTISANIVETQSFYPQAGSLVKLAKQIKQSGFPYTHLVIDNSFFTGNKLAPGWEVADIQGGYITSISTVMLDGGRYGKDLSAYSQKTSNPALTVGSKLAELLGISPKAVTISDSKVPTKNKILGQIYSPPLWLRVKETLEASDNVLAETLGRELAVALGYPHSFSGAVAAISQVLREANLPVSQIDLRDSSGLSTNNSLTSEFLTKLLIKIVHSPNLAVKNLITYLPVAGVSGTLASRFTSLTTQKAAGWVRAKSGTLNNVSALAGFIQTTNNKIYAFSFLQNNMLTTLGSELFDRILNKIWENKCPI